MIIHKEKKIKDEKVDKEHYLSHHNLLQGIKQTVPA